MSGCNTQGAKFTLTPEEQAIGYARSHDVPILIAWCNYGAIEHNGEFMRAAAGVKIIALGRTANGSPIHPAARGKHRIPRDAQPIVLRHAA